MSVRTSASGMTGHHFLSTRTPPRPMLWLYLEVRTKLGDPSPGVQGGLERWPELLWHGCEFRSV